MDKHELARELVRLAQELTAPKLAKGPLGKTVRVAGATFVEQIERIAKRANENNAPRIVEVIREFIFDDGEMAQYLDRIGASASTTVPLHNAASSLLSVAWMWKKGKADERDFQQSLKSLLRQVENNEPERCWKIKERLPVVVDVEEGWRGDVIVVPKMKMTYETYNRIVGGSGVGSSRYSYKNGEAKFSLNVPLEDFFERYKKYVKPSPDAKKMLGS